MASNNLTKREIVLRIYEELNMPGVREDGVVVAQKDIQVVVEHCLNTIQQALAAGRNVELRNFGVFEVQVRKARVGRNPNRPETDVMIPERAVVKFKAGKELKAQLRQLDLAEVKDETQPPSA
jgi:nucleoid DNA-binding protein